MVRVDIVEDMKMVEVILKVFVVFFFSQNLEFN